MPTVVDAATIASDAIELASNSHEGLKDSFGDDDARYEFIKSVLMPFEQNLIVTPKDIDIIIEHMSKIISQGLNLSLQKSMSYEDSQIFAL